MSENRTRSHILKRKSQVRLIAKFHYTGPTGSDQTKSADFVGDPGLRPESREKVRAGPCGSGRARVVEFSL